MPRLRHNRLVSLTEAALPVIGKDKSHKKQVPVTAPVTRDCPRCGTTFKVWRPNDTADSPNYQAYCGPKCSRAAKRKTLAPVPDPRITSTENGERYYVIACTGWPIGDGASAPGNNGRRVPTVYTILDGAWCDREVETFALRGGSSRDIHRRRAIKRCAELNADERDWENSEGKYAPKKRTVAKRCREGHVLNESNTYRYPDGRTHCKRCRREKSLPWWKRKPTV